VPDLHKIWVGTSDQQLMALSNEFPGFYRYALIMEEASEAERNKASRAGCIGNGCPIWMASKTLYARRVRNPRHWST